MSDHVFKVPDLPMPKGNGALPGLVVPRTGTMTSSTGFTDSASTTSSKREAVEIVDGMMEDGYDSTLQSDDDYPTTTTATTDDESVRQERATQGRGEEVNSGAVSPNAAKRRRQVFHRDYNDDDEDDDDDELGALQGHTEKLRGFRATSAISEASELDDGDRPDDFFFIPVIGKDQLAANFLLEMLRRAQTDIEKSSFCSMKFDEARHRIKLWGTPAQIVDAKRSLDGVGRDCLKEIEHRSKHALEVPHQRIGRAPTTYQIKLMERREKRLAEKKQWCSTDDADHRKMPVIGVFEWPGAINLKTHYASDLRMLFPLCMDCEVYMKYEGDASGGPLYIYGKTESNVKKAMSRLENCYLRLRNMNNLESFAQGNVKHILKIFSRDLSPFVLQTIFPEERKGVKILDDCPQPTMMRCFRQNTQKRQETLHPPLRESEPLEVAVSRPLEADRMAARLISVEPDLDDEDLDIDTFQNGLGEIVKGNLQTLKKTLLNGLGHVNILHGSISLKFILGAGVLRSYPKKGLGPDVVVAGNQLANPKMSAEIREAIVLTESAALTILADLEAKKRRSGEVVYKTLLEANAARSSIFKPTSKDRQAKRATGHSSVILEVKYNEDGSIANWNAQEGQLRVVEVNVIGITTEPSIGWSAAVDFAKLAPTKPDECVYEPLVQSMTSPPAATQERHASGISIAREVRFKNPNGGELRLGLLERQQIYSYWWNDESDLVLDVIYHELWDCSDLALGKVSGYEVRFLPAQQVGTVQKNIDKNRPARNYWSFEARSPELAVKLAQNNDLGPSKPGVRPTWRATSDDIFGSSGGIVDLVNDVEDMVDYLAEKGIAFFRPKEGK